MLLLNQLSLIPLAYLLGILVETGDGVIGRDDDLPVLLLGLQTQQSSCNSAIQLSLETEIREHKYL